MKKVLLSLISIGITSSLAIGLTNAFFSDTETSTENTLTAGTFDLLIDGQNNPTAIVNFTDLKPGDNYIEEKTVTLQNAGYVWMHLIDYETGQGIQTEPETVEEKGTPKFDIDRYLTYDLSTPTASESNALIHQDDNVPFADVFSCWIPLGEFPAGTSSIYQSFHFDPTVTNWAQGDILTFSEEFYAVQSRNNPSPTPPPSESGRTWDAIEKRCEDCTPIVGTVYANSVVTSLQGKRKNNTDVLATRSNPNDALGSPNGNGNTGTGFFSLGYGGTITVQFASPVYDGVGGDISFHEITNGRNTYPSESAKVEVSSDNVIWYELTPNTTSEPGGDGIVYLDISSNASAPHSVQFVRITDTTIAANNTDPLSDGYDLDAIDAVYSSCVSTN